jgi:DNA-binding NarL/FixJ family response regulator
MRRTLSLDGPVDRQNTLPASGSSQAVSRCALAARRVARATSLAPEVRDLAAEATAATIVAELFLSPKTVGSHVEHILTKLSAARRAEIAAWVAALPPGPGPAAG